MGIGKVIADLPRRRRPRRQRPASPSAFTADLAATVAAAEQLGFPVVLKTVASDILHKTDADGVILGLHDRVAVADAYTRIAAACGKLGRCRQTMRSRL
jgi:acyl-CoA synthetase (NDP forming)